MGWKRSPARAALLAAAALATVLPGCREETTLTEPVAGREAGLADAPPARRVVLLDRCEPESFNAVLGEGSCIGNGKVTFEELLAVLGKKQVHPRWRIRPPNVPLKTEPPLAVVNEGGEVHTFTEVEEFGGGIVPLLNQLSGNPDVAPECAAIEGSDFLAPATTTILEGEEEEGTELHQCCIPLDADRAARARVALGV